MNEQSRIISGDEFVFRTVVLNMILLHRNKQSLFEATKDDKNFQSLFVAFNPSQADWNRQILVQIPSEDLAGIFFALERMQVSEKKSSRLIV